MQRRDFLGGLGAALAVAKAGVARAAAPSTRVAIVIGVDKVKGLAGLSASAESATKIGTWLTGEGFDVKYFTDEKGGPVKRGDIFDTINALVDLGTLTQLVVYFSGHGIISDSLSELWLLSNATVDPVEAIDLYKSSVYARECGITNVAFISDACRSLPASLTQARVTGSVVFPPRQPTERRPYIDLFFATRPGDAAFEIPAPESILNYQAIYTECFLDLFQRPDTSMVEDIDGVSVVPSKRLKPFLEDEVQRRVEASSARHTQVPDTRVESDDSIYIGRAGKPIKRPPARGASVAPTIFDIIEREFEKVQTNFYYLLNIDLPNDTITNKAKEIGFDVAFAEVIRARQAMPAKLEAGAVVWGVNVENAVALGAKVAAVTRGDGKDVSTTVTVATGDTPGGLSLRFASQTGTAVAVAAGYAANVLVGNDGRVSDVSYVPTSDGPFRDLYDKNRDKIEQLHATVATAARFGAFRFEGDRGQRLRAASIWLETISEFIPADPSLALHTAYAFHDADVVELLKPLRNILADLPALRIFDLALLTGSEASGGYQPRVPMLSRGWAIVDVKGVKLDAEMQEAGEHRQLALWTTFDSKGIAIVESFYGRS